MKYIHKGIEPQSLINYRNAVPQSTWQQMKDDAHFGGSDAYSESRDQLIRDQGGLCAYCEINISHDDPLTCRIEHFHPKSHITAVKNWALDWNNFLGVCAGGSYKYTDALDHYLEPTRENLSCDAYKDQQIQTGKLAEQCEGWILNPTQIIAYPNLFKIEKHTGNLVPNEVACMNSPIWPNNQHTTVQELVQHTIDMLNLNCLRLSQARLSICRDIERNKKKQRIAGFSPQIGLDNLANRYLLRRWPRFFTTIRLCLGDAAERYLTAITYQG